MITKSGFVADKIVITRREDGHWDLEAFMPLPGFSCGSENSMAKVTMILEDASLEVVANYALRQDLEFPDWTETIPARVVSYKLTLSSWLCGGVGGQPKIFMRQQVVEV